MSNHMEVIKAALTDPELTKNELRVLLCIVFFSTKEKKRILRSFLSETLKIDANRISKITSDLQRKGYINKVNVKGVIEYEQTYQNGKTYQNGNTYQNGKPEPLTESVSTYQNGNITTLYNKTNTVYSIHNTDSPAENPAPPPFAEIIRDLNLVTKKRFSHQTEKTRVSIKARFNDGFTLEDFKHVHRVKSEQWLNSDMEKYLRPATLYGNKFENYLNERLKSEIEKSVTEEKMTSMETQDAIANLNLLQRGLNKQLN